MVHRLFAVGPGANDVPSLSLLVSGFGLRTGPSWSSACPYCLLENPERLLKKREAWKRGHFYKKGMVDRVRGQYLDVEGRMDGWMDF